MKKRKRNQLRRTLHKYKWCDCNKYILWSTAKKYMGEMGQKDQGKY